ncbi:MAG: biotin/lipoate A/B protein ligase family protein [Litorilinea sp.]
MTTPTKTAAAPKPAQASSTASNTANESFAPTTWRLIIDDAPRSGAANMALDQALAEACAAGDAPPTLRFYRWEPPAVSLGRHQPITDIDAAVVAANGYTIVRRPTGGRAILHTDEFTYSVAAPDTEPRVQGSVMEAYLRLSEALLAGLHRLNVPADKAGGDVRAGSDVSAACFETPSAYEITAGTRKLMGSAQSRRAGYVLQHGSLPLYGDIGRLVDVLALPAPVRLRLRRDLVNRACTLADALDLPPHAPQLGFEAVAAAMRAGFAQVLNLELKPSPPTSAEIRRTAELIRQQYGNADWTARKS